MARARTRNARRPLRTQLSLTAASVREQDYRFSSNAAVTIPPVSDGIRLPRLRGGALYYSPEFRVRRRTGFLILVAALLVLPLTQASGSKPGAVVLVGLVVAFFEWRTRRLGFAFDPDGFELSFTFSTRKIAWDQIESISVENVRSYYGGALAVHTRAGERRQVSGVLVRPDNDVVVAVEPVPGLPARGSVVAVLRTLLERQGVDVPVRTPEGWQPTGEPVELA